MQTYVCEKCGQKANVAGVQQTFDAIEAGLKNIASWPNNLTYMVSPEFTKWVTDHHKLCDGKIRIAKKR